MNLIIEKENLYQLAAEKIAELLIKSLSKKDKVVLGLPGGRSIPHILNYLSRSILDWSRVHVFIVDERLVPISNPDSNFGLIANGLSGIVNKENLHPFVFQEGKEDISIKKYTEEIKKFGGFYDILVVSIGEDGHIGSIYPDHPSIKDQSDFYILVNNSPKPPSNRMSMSARMVLRSKACVVIVSGNQKREAMTCYLDDDIDIINCPAKLTLKIPEIFVFSDIDLNINGI